MAGLVQMANGDAALTCRFDAQSSKAPQPCEMALQEGLQLATVPTQSCTCQGMTLMLAVCGCRASTDTCEIKRTIGELLIGTNIVHSKDCNVVPYG